MSDILDMINNMKKIGFDDKKILKKVRHCMKKHNNLKNQRGGGEEFELEEEEIEDIRDNLALIKDRSVVDDDDFFRKIDNLIETKKSTDFENKDEMVARLREILEKYEAKTVPLQNLDSLDQNKTANPENNATSNGEPADEELEGPEKDLNNLGKAEVTVDDMNEKTETIESAIQESVESAESVDEEEETVSSYDKIKKGTILYFPSSDITRFNNSNILLVDLKKVIDKNKKRSFTVFFTESKAYAFMFGGITTLNKKAVYIHQFRVKETIQGIKKIHPNILTKDVEDVADGFCGVTEDGQINGIKIERKTNRQNINEYYLCNPENKLTHIKTYMQISANEFVPYTEDTIEFMNIPEDENDRSRGKLNNIDEDGTDDGQTGEVDTDDKGMGSDGQTGEVDIDDKVMGSDGQTGEFEQDDDQTITV